MPQDPGDSHSVEGEFYEDQARYGHWDQSAESRLRVSLAAMMALTPQRVLDIGCGDGFFALRIKAETGAEVWGVDISQTSVSLAAGRGLPCKLCDAGSAIPFEDEHFDLVFCGEVLEHLLNPDRLLEEACRTLVPGGHIVLSTPNLAAWFNRVLLPLGFQPIFTETSVRRVLGRRWRILGQGGVPMGHLRLYTAASLRELFALCGFECVHIRGASFAQVPIVRSLDRFFSHFATLASVLVAVGKKA